MQWFFKIQHSERFTINIPNLNFHFRSTHLFVCINMSHEIVGKYLYWKIIYLSEIQIQVLRLHFILQSYFLEVSSPMLLYHDHLPQLRLRFILLCVWSKGSIKSTVNYSWEDGTGQILILHLVYKMYERGDSYKLGFASFSSDNISMPPPSTYKM